MTFPEGVTTEQKIEMAARYFKLEPTAEINGKTLTSIGEVGILLK